jgi:hypothetical protein
MSYWIYVLIGDNDTGKTSFQKHLLEHLCGKIYEKLVTNQVYDVIHPRAPKSFKTIFIANRSYQEKAAQYGSPKQYYEKYVKTADVTILASHVHPPSPTHIAEFRLGARGVLQRRWRLL